MKSVLTGKCPRCKSSEIFCTSNPYNFKRLFLMPDHCDSCGLKFNREPGFFYGSMYVGYGISIAYLISFYVAMMVLFGDFELSLYFIFGIGSLLILTPVVFRLSRSIWLSLFVKFDKDAIDKWKKFKGDNQIDNPCIEV